MSQQAANEHTQAESGRASAQSQQGSKAVSFAAVAPVQMLTNEAYHFNATNTVIGGTSVKESNGASATVAPADYDTGSGTNEGVRAVSQAATAAFGMKFIAGHMLNNHLGGTGTDQKNISAISAGQNSQHHSYLEKSAKNQVKAGGKTINYYTYISKRADFYDKAGVKLVAKGLASELTGGYSIPATGASVGPVVIPLGPPASLSVKKNEGGTGLGAGGAAVAGLTESDENNAAIAMTMAEAIFHHSGADIAKAYPGADEEYLSEPIQDMLKVGKDVFAVSKQVNIWADLVRDAVKTGKAAPPFFGN